MVRLCSIWTKNHRWLNIVTIYVTKYFQRSYNAHLMCGVSLRCIVSCDLDYFHHLVIIKGCKSARNCSVLQLNIPFSEFTEPLAKKYILLCHYHHKQYLWFLLFPRHFPLSGHKRLPNEKNATHFHFQIQIARFIVKGALKCKLLEYVYMS